MGFICKRREDGTFEIRTIQRIGKYLNIREIYRVSGLSFKEIAKLVGITFKELLKFQSGYYKLAECRYRALYTLYSAMEILDRGSDEKNRELLESEIGGSTVLEYIMSGRVNEVRELYGDGTGREIIGKDHPEYRSPPYALDCTYYY